MYKYITDDRNFYDLALELSEGRHQVAFCDLETTGLDPRQDKILLFQIMVGEEIYIFDFLRLNNEHLKYLVNLLKNVAKVKAVFHNAKFDLKFIYTYTGEWLTNVFDTMNCEVVLNAGIGSSTYSLKFLALKYCGIDLQKEDREAFYKEEVKVITDQMLNYSAMDVKVLRDIYEQQMERVIAAKEGKIIDMEMQLIPVVAHMEYNGVLLDKEKWASLEAQERLRLDRVTAGIKEKFIEGLDFTGCYKDANELAQALSIPKGTKKAMAQRSLLTTPDTMQEFVRQTLNLGSPKQLKSALSLLGINVESVDKKVLKKLGEKNSAIVNLLLEKSEAAKRISTYGTGVFEFIHPLTGRIHTEFLNNGTATGRFSSGNPINLQNIPNAPGYRESFISSPGFTWLSLDYSQQEFRLAGAVSREPIIIDAYKQGLDMHTATASLIFNKPLKDIEKKERTLGKTANFAILYGGTEYTLGKNLGLSKEKALEIMEAFNSGYPVFSAFKKAVEDKILELGYSTTVMGRRRYNPERPLYQTGNEYMQYVGRVKREGFNHVIQGGAADITKIAMVKIWQNNPFGDKLRMMIQVHDEINLEAESSIAQEAAEFVKQMMLEAEQPFLGEIPAAVDCNIGDHWVH